MDEEGLAAKRVVFTDLAQAVAQEGSRGVRRGLAADRHMAATSTLRITEPHEHSRRVQALRWCGLALLTPLLA